MDFDLLLISRVTASTLIFFLLFILCKKQLWLTAPDKKTETCSQNSDIVSKANKLESKKTLFLRMKTFLIRPRFNFFRKLKISNRLPNFCLFFRSFFIRFTQILKNKEKTIENKAEINLHKLAKSLWDKGKYSEAEQIMLEVLNIKRLVGIDKNNIKS
jgi:hypothetical protein